MDVGTQTEAFVCPEDEEEEIEESDEELIDDDDSPDWEPCMEGDEQRDDDDDDIEDQWHEADDPTRRYIISADCLMHLLGMVPCAVCKLPNFTWKLRESGTAVIAEGKESNT